MDMGEPLYKLFADAFKRPRLPTYLWSHKPRMPFPNFIFAGNGSTLFFNSCNRTTTRISGSYNRVRYRSSTSCGGEFCASWGVDGNNRTWSR